MSEPSPIAAQDVARVRTARVLRLHPSGAHGALLLQRAADEYTYLDELYWVAGLSGARPSARLANAGGISDLAWSGEGSVVCTVEASSPGCCTVRIGAWTGDMPAAPFGEAVPTPGTPEGLCWDLAGTRLCFVMHIASGGPSLGALSSGVGYRIIQDAVPFKTESSGYRASGYSQLFEIRRSADAGWTLRQVTERPEDCLMPALSPDGRRAACVRPSSGPDRFFGNQRVVVVDLDTGDEATIAVPGGPCWFPVWAPAGNRLAWLAHDGRCGVGEGTDLRVWAYDGTASVQHELTLARSVEDVILDDTSPVPGTGARPLAWDQDGRGVFCLITDGGTTGLYYVPLTTGERHRPAPVIVGPRRVFGFCHAAGRILAAVADPADPCRIIDVRSDDGEEREVFAPNRAWLADRRLSQPRKFAFPGAGGAALDGWFMPPIARSVEGAACILLINRGRFGWSFNFEAQLLAGRGFAVAYVNPSGSYGYGEGFRGITHYDPATHEVDDIIRAVDALVHMGIDGTRVGASGSSFGGFMVNWLVSHYPVRFAAAVAQASYCNRHSLWGTSSIGPSRWDRPGPPWEQAAFLLSRSPLSFAASVQVPILIIHGDRDTICPIEQAEQWYSALTILGRRPAWLLLEGEGHDLARGARPISRIRRMTAVAEWFQRHLGGDVVRS